MKFRASVKTMLIYIVNEIIYYFYTIMQKQKKEEADFKIYVMFEIEVL